MAQTSKQSSNMSPLIEINEGEDLDSGIVSTVAIASHPLHPLLVTFPIAFLVAAAGTDIGYWLTSDPFWARASVWLIGAGFAAGLAAALATGFLAAGFTFNFSFGAVLALAAPAFAFTGAFFAFDEFGMFVCRPFLVVETSPRPKFTFGR